MQIDMNLRHQRHLDFVQPFGTYEELPEIVQRQLAAIRPNLKTVVVTYEGGTAGMKPDAQGDLVPTNDPGDLLQPLTLKGLGERVNVIWFNLFPAAIDSTNGRWPHWVTQGNAIRLFYDDVDGFTSIGGTDTKAHELAAMNFILPNFGKPHFGVAGQRSRYFLGDDSTNNIFLGIYAAAFGDVSGHHLAFRETFRHGLHTHKVQDKRFDAFACAPRYELGHFDGDGNLNFYPNCPRRNRFVTKKDLIYEPFFREVVRVSKISPATPAGALLHDATCPYTRALLYLTFGAGNVRNEGLWEGDETHIEAIKQMREDGYPVVLGTSMMDGSVDSAYKGGREAVSPDIGALSGGDTRGATLEVKVMRAAHDAWVESDQSIDYGRFKSAMAKDYVGELLHKEQCA